MITGARGAERWLLVLHLSAEAASISDMDTATLVERITADLGLTVAGEAPTGSASGSLVLPVTTSAGVAAMLKITIGAGGVPWSASLRELDFYRQLAGVVGVRTPRLLDHQQTDDSIALVVTRHPAPRPAQDWSHDHWLLLADDLAVLHRRPVDASPSPRSLPDPAWAAAAFWRGSGATIARLLDEPGDLQERAAALGPTFVHGDCHADNISVTAEGLVWLDWQGSGPGNPAGDLAFPGVRARPSGVDVPVADIVQRYAQQRHLSPAAVSDAVLASVLLVLLFEWPDYAQFNSAEGNQRVRDRARQLSDRAVAQR